MVDANPSTKTSSFPSCISPATNGPSQWTGSKKSQIGSKPELSGAGEREVEANNIGELVINELKDLDQVAYVRFASVYRQFKDLSDFEKELRQLASPQAGD